MMISKKTGSTLAYLVLALFASGSIVSAQILDRPVAIVRLTETVNIGQREIRQQVAILEQQMGRTLTTRNREEVLEAQIGDVLLRQAAARENVRVSSQEVDQAIAVQRQQLGQPVSDADFRRLVQEETGLTWDQYRQEISSRLVQERFILERAEGRFGEIQEPATREIRQVYEENAQQFTNPAMARFEHLFFDLRNRTTQQEQELRQRANQLARDIQRTTTTFQQLMRASLDDPGYAGGDFGYLLRGDRTAIDRLGRAFVETVLDMEEGDVSGVIESNVGLHIVRITDRRNPRMLQIGDPLLPGENVTVRDQIRSYIISQRQQEIFQQSVETVLQELKNQAEITRFPENLDW
jgi:peptidyl-prolyl cis-trans isomerase SurA